MNPTRTELKITIAKLIEVAYFRRQKGSYYYQKLDSQKGCLSINGIELNKDPVSLHIEYKKERGLWLVDYMFLHLIESNEDYVKKALCPRDVESTLF